MHLGFEVGSGKPVSIPLKHMVVTGQTQEAGKTTTLEALITRAGVKAIAFITKRGEGSFGRSRVIAPYFRERADWQYVAAILEASRGEKLKFERAWIIRASKGARSLGDVHRNVRKALETAKGLSADVYLTLDAYLEAVVPQIEKVRWAQTVDLAAGINAMDLGGLNVEMQHLVIRSTIEWVLEHGQDTVVVVPEAWKFIPQGRGTPVKLAAEAFIRQAAALHNYLWLDSQDIAGIEKLILKSVPVWILGVQREINEVKRTLDQMPVALPKLTPRQIATLRLGEFYACYGEHAIKTYVQPVWATTDKARAVAMGDHTLPPRPDAIFTEIPEGGFVTPEEAARLRDENRTLAQRLAALEDELREYRASAIDRLTTQAQKLTSRTVDAPPSPTPAGEPVSALLAGEDLYEAIKRRLVEDAPGLIRLLTVKPEIVVEVARETVRMDGKSLRGRVVQLLAKGFFDAGCMQTQVRTELERRGAGVSDAKNLPRELDALVQMGFLTIEDGKDSKGRGRKLYLAVPGMKVNILEAA